MNQHDAHRLGDLLAGLRRRQRVSQQELARVSRLSRAIISIIERGHDPSTNAPPNPRPDTLRQLAAGLATDGDGSVNSALSDQLYRELMLAAGYMPADPWSLEAELRAAGLDEQAIRLGLDAASEYSDPLFLRAFARAWIAAWQAGLAATLLQHPGGDEQPERLAR